MQELTKKEAIRLHREMWNWIAERAEKGSALPTLLLKERYLAMIFGNNQGNWPIYSCFCCEYAR